MHNTSALVLTRIQRFLRERIQPAVIADRAPLDITAWDAPDEPVPFSTAVGQTYAAVATGTLWGKPWGTTWFHVTGQIPTSWRAPEGVTIELDIDLGFTHSQAGFQAEGLVWRPDGSIVKALEPFNSWVPVDSDTIDLYVEAASNPDVGSTWMWTASPYGDKRTAGTDPIYTLKNVDAVLRDETVWELERDITTLLGLYQVLPHDRPRAAEILRALENCVDVVDPHAVSATAAAGREALADVLAAPANASAHRVSATGHAHIDSAWLWPVRETVRKCARTFSNVLALMDEDPDFVFACSSAQQFAWVKEHYPALFERIAARVAEGRFIPVGGMWVESDTNMPGSEAMARQFVAGKGFFLREFGVDTPEVWLPDSFGYSGALPQIARAAGAKYFLTQKLSWNETDRMPHHSFDWEGIDGTRIFTHFPPVDTYNSDLSPAELDRAERQYAEKGRANRSLVPFGYGDGGGGPTREMLATGRRARDLEGSPRVSIEAPETFFAAADAEYPDRPVWSGEMYLEFHRGTYTSQARTKRGNRRSEHLLREAELWATTATVRTGAEYPAVALQRAWETVLLNQFHDILPGSSIAWVYAQAEAEYAEVATELEALIADAVTALGARAEDGVAFNASPFTVDGIPALGAGRPVRPGRAHAALDDGGAILSNDAVSARFDASGRIVSLIDIATGREYVAPGGAVAELQLFRDTPNQWDAWDVDVHYRRHLTVVDDVDELSCAARDDGSAVVVVRRSFGASTISQEFRLAGAGRTVEVLTTIDWHERQKLLKLAFDLDVAADRAASEIQFGHVHRAIAENTSWDMARFETSAHRWMHVGEPGAGVAVANDSTYGHDVTRHPRVGGGSATLLRQSLLRAPLFPDPEADQGTHEMRSSVTIGADISDAVREGYRLNLPLREAAVAAVSPLLTVSDPAVVVEAIKLAEDGSGDVIVRLYESGGSRRQAVVTIDFPHGEVRETDLLERAVPASSVTGSDETGVQLALRPFELLTLHIPRG